MKVKNNYNECITNLACSIRKYFELDYHHNTLKEVDELLDKNQPKNVVMILCDGMGSRILDKILDSNSFLIKNRLKEITTVFPATTVAATTSITTGLNPVETAMLGWDMYYKDLDKVITTFKSCEKSDPNHTVLEEAINYNNCHMKTKPITKEINEKGKYIGYGLYPFGKDPYKDEKEMDEKIIKYCNEPGKKFIYAYQEEPDASMHCLGTYHEKVKQIIRDINRRVEEISNKVEDTLIIVVADHGHISVENIHLKDYPDIVDCLLRNTSIEPRAVNFFIKEGRKEEFVELFNKYFGKDFDLYNIEEVIESHLFGDGEENEVYRDILGDYLAIGKTNKTILYQGNSELLSQHAGYTDEEIYVPLIVINKEKS